jgi:hypothetical protein
MSTISRLLVNILDDAFNGSGWQGPDNLVNTVEKLTLEQLIHPSPHEGYTIWQIVLHCAYWKWAVLRTLVGEKAGGFPRLPEDFPSLPEERSLEKWREDFQLLLEQHEAVRNVVLEFPESEWWEVPPKVSNAVPHIKRVYGLAAHDVYHTGQIRNMGIPNL